MRKIREMLGELPRLSHRARRAVLMTTLSAAALGSACRGNTEEQEVAEPAAPTYLMVRNQAFLDMNIYVYRSSQRIRLGTVNGSSSARILLPANLLFGPTSLRFQADPIGGGRKPITEEISVSAGDEIQLTIPPT